MKHQSMTNNVIKYHVIDTEVGISGEVSCKESDMEKELIKYVLELVGDDDWICEELHKNSNECEYCSNHCTNLNENCVRRLINNRIINGREKRDLD